MQRVFPLLVLFALAAAAHAAPKPGPVALVSASGVAELSLPGGTFTMGGDKGYEDEVPAHAVAVGAFVMDTFEVTQAEYRKLTGKNPAKFRNPRNPVEQVRWSDAALFCNARSKAEGLRPCYDPATFACDFAANGYRLPTEAEWEYAARAGTARAYDFSNDPQKLATYAVFQKNAPKKTLPAGSKRLNTWGFADLYGNVQEWCNDWYDAAYYATSPAKDPHGPATGGKKVLRGGAWNLSAESCRAASRASDDPGMTDACFLRDSYGFRCVRRQD